MKRFSEQLKKKADGVRLSASERTDLRERLGAYMEYHPFPEAATKSTKETIPAEPYKSVSFRSVYFKGAFGFLALLLVVGVPLIAERSLPGDVLYPVKVSFNEELRSSLTLSPYEKVEWETQRLGRRIAEARLLASEGKLTEEYEEEVAQAVREHSDAAKREIETLRGIDAEEAAIAKIAFSSALEVQSAMLRGAGSTTATDAIATAVAAERSEAEEQSENETTPSLDRLVARIEQETTRAHELLGSIRRYATDQEVADIERRLLSIESKLGDAIEMRQEENVNVSSIEASEAATTTDVAEATPQNERDMRRVLRDALKDAQKLIVFMTDIDVRETVLISDLIPVELTDDERAAVIEEVLTEIEKGVETAEAELASTTDEAILEKATTGLAAVREQHAIATTSLSSGELDAAEVAATEAFNLIRDVASLLGIEPVATTTEPSTEPTGEDPAATTTDSAVQDEDEAATSTEAGEEEDLLEGEGTGTSTATTSAATTTPTSDDATSTVEAE